MEAHPEAQSETLVQRARALVEAVFAPPEAAAVDSPPRLASGQGTEREFDQFMGTYFAQQAEALRQMACWHILWAADSVEAERDARFNNTQDDLEIALKMVDDANSKVAQRWQLQSEFDELSKAIRQSGRARQA